MSNVIEFLETLGRNPALNMHSPDAYADAVVALEIEDAQRRALLDRDPVALNGLLGGRDRMLCSVFAPEREEPGESSPDEEEQDEPDEAPSRDPDERK